MLSDYIVPCNLTEKCIFKGRPSNLLSFTPTSFLVGQYVPIKQPSVFLSLLTYQPLKIISLFLFQILWNLVCIHDTGDSPIQHFRRKPHLAKVPLRDNGEINFRSNSTTYLYNSRIGITSPSLVIDDASLETVGGSADYILDK